MIQIITKRFSILNEILENKNINAKIKQIK